MTWTRFHTQDPHMVGAIVPSSVARPTWHTVFVRLWCLPWEFKCVMLYFVLFNCSLLDSKQVCGKYIAVQWATPDSPPVRLNPVCLAVPFCEPFVITHHSSWLFNFAEYSHRDHCSTEVPFSQHKYSCYEVCAWPAVCSHCMCLVRRCGTDGRDVVLLWFNRGWVGLKAVIGLRCLSVAGVNWTQTELRNLHVGWKQDVNTCKCTVRRVLKIVKSDLAASCLPVCSSVLVEQFKIFSIMC